MARRPEKKSPRATDGVPLAEALIARADEMVRREGHEAVSLRPLAASLGVSHVAALHHFATRDALLAAVAVRGFDELVTVVGAVARGERPSQGFRRLGEAYVAWACANANLYKLMFASRLRAGGAHPAVEERANRLFELVADVVARGQAAGELREAPPEEDAFFAWATAHGAALLLVDEQATFASLGRRSARALVAAALDGVGRGTRRDPRGGRDDERRT